MAFNSGEYKVKRNGGNKNEKKGGETRMRKCEDNVLQILYRGR